MHRGQASSQSLRPHRLRALTGTTGAPVRECVVDPSLPDSEAVHCQVAENLQSIPGVSPCCPLHVHNQEP
jgi:hypothetical protein